MEENDFVHTGSRHHTFQGSEKELSVTIRSSAIFKRNIHVPLVNPGLPVVSAPTTSHEIYCCLFCYKFSPTLKHFVTQTSRSRICMPFNILLNGTVK